MEVLIIMRGMIWVKLNRILFRLDDKTSSIFRDIVRKEEIESTIKKITKILVIK